MTRKDFDFDGVRARLLRFWRAPVELLIVAPVAVTLSGILAVASHPAQGRSYGADHADLSGFHMCGALLWGTLACYGAALLCRVRPSFNIPRRYCDGAAYTLTLFSLARIAAFLLVPPNGNGSLFHAVSTFHFYMMPGPGILFLLAAPVLLWRAAALKRVSEATIYNDMSSPIILVPLPKTDTRHPTFRGRSE